MGEPLIVNGQPFNRPADAARALGVSLNAVYTAKREGRLDRVGDRPRVGNPKPVALFKHTWPTMAQCCADLGCAEKTLRAVVHGTATERQVENMRARVEEWAGTTVTAPVTTPATFSTPVFPTAASAPPYTGAV